MGIKIDQKIVKSEVLAQSAAEQDDPARAEVIHMHENLARPEALQGTTYKIKTPLSEHALYVTINDITYNLLFFLKVLRFFKTNYRKIQPFFR